MCLVPVGRLKYYYQPLSKAPTMIQKNVGFMFNCGCKSYRSFFRTSKTVTRIVKDVPQPPAAHIDPSKHSPNILKPVVFTLFFSSASFAGAAVWQYENMRTRAKELLRSPQKWIVDRVNPSNLWIREKFGQNIQIQIQKHGSLRQICNTMWNSMSEGQKIFVPILFANVMVYLAWKVPGLRPMMMNYFVSNPTSKRVCVPMFLSTFSHTSLIHLLANMFVLNSFITAIVPSLGKEQFLAFYFSAGLVSSLASHVYRSLSRDLAVSIGASGAIMGVLGYTCTKYPDTILSIIFIPFFTFKAGMGLKALMAVDFTCLLMKFKIFDHAAHLGGALFGVFWCVWGNEHIWQQRGPLLEWWHKQRNKSSKS